MADLKATKDKAKHMGQLSCGEGLEQEQHPEYPLHLSHLTILNAVTYRSIMASRNGSSSNKLTFI